MTLHSISVVDFGLQLLKVSADEITFDFDKCAAPNQLFTDDYRVLSTNADSTLHCATIVNFHGCEKFFFSKMEKMCVCVIADDANTSPSRDLTVVNNMKSKISDALDPTLYYVPGTKQRKCNNKLYHWIPAIKMCIRIDEQDIDFQNATKLCPDDGARVFAASTRKKSRALERFLVCNGLNNREILSALAHSDGVIFSNSTLKRKLKTLGLYRRKKYSDIIDVACFLLTQLETSGSSHGYRWMHLKCKQSGYNIPRDLVYGLMRLLDPKGVQSRKRGRLKRRQYLNPGPNFVWHIDAYDKLKPYGIAISGCIDGYSRYVIWLEAATTNSDPKVIASYYVDSITKANGCPKRIRADLGTENTYVGNMQVFLRQNHDDEFAGDKSFLCGKSTHNQRIEWFWGLLRREMGQFFMDLFSDFGSDHNDLFCGDMLDKNLIQFCFLDVIQANLDELRSTWNTHVLQSKTNGIGGPRRPILMYTIPELYQAEDHLCRVAENKVLICAEETQEKTMSCADETIFELCTLLMEENDFSKPRDSNEARRLYTNLRQLIREELADVQ